jgi:hypothetical protein
VWIEIGRVRISGEWSLHWHWTPTLTGRFERDPYCQDYYNCVWEGDVHWLGWWIQIVVGAS